MLLVSLATIFFSVTTALSILERYNMTEAGGCFAIFEAFEV